MATKPQAWIERVSVAEGEHFDLDWHDRVLWAEDLGTDNGIRSFRTYVLRREGQ